MLGLVMVNSNTVHADAINWGTDDVQNSAVNVRSFTKITHVHSAANAYTINNPQNNQIKINYVDLNGRNINQNQMVQVDETEQKAIAAPSGYQLNGTANYSSNVTTHVDDAAHRASDVSYKMLDTYDPKWSKEAVYQPTQKSADGVYKDQWATGTMPDKLYTDLSQIVGTIYNGDFLIPHFECNNWHDFKSSRSTAFSDIEYVKASDADQYWNRNTNLGQTIWQDEMEFGGQNSAAGKAVFNDLYNLVKSDFTTYLTRPIADREVREETTDDNDPNIQPNKLTSEGLIDEGNQFFRIVLSVPTKQIVDNGSVAVAGTAVKGVTGNVVNVAVTKPVEVHDGNLDKLSVKRTITLHFPNGVKPESYNSIVHNQNQIVQLLSFTRDVVKDSLTGNILSESAWRGDNKFSDIKLPKIPGFKLQIS